MERENLQLKHLNRLDKERRSVTRNPMRADRPRLIATKFRAPSGDSALVARDRLLARLDAQRHRRLMLIHGPAGFGKTTLSVQWRERLQATGAAVAWLSLSSEDNALDRFLTYLVEAVRVGDSTLALDVVAQFEARPEHAASIVVTELVNAFEHAQRDFYLVMDDWHLIVDRQVHDTVKSLLEFAPPRFHIVIMSRERPNLPLARLRVAGELCEIGASDLRFTVDESHAFLCDVNALPLDAATVELLWSSTEGWVAALQLASLSLRNAADDLGSADRPYGQLLDGVAATFGGDHHALGEYLAENVLDLLPVDCWRFWLTGRQVAERTNASTTGLLSVTSREWDEGLIEAVGLPRALFPDLVDPGTTIGALLPPVGEAIERPGVPVVAVGSHDTASAVVGAPLDGPGLRRTSPSAPGASSAWRSTPRSSPTQRARPTSPTRGASTGTIRLLTNVMGTWLLSETLRTWGRSDLGPLLEAAADVTGDVPVFDVQDPRFVPPGDMPSRIAAWCAEHDVAAPVDDASLVAQHRREPGGGVRRCAGHRRIAVGRDVRQVHVVGGGSQNTLLCQAIATGPVVPVVAGPVEATALGNVLVAGPVRAGAVDGGLDVLRDLVRVPTT